MLYKNTMGSSIETQTFSLYVPVDSVTLYGVEESSQKNVTIESISTEETQYIDLSSVEEYSATISISSGRTSSGVKVYLTTSASNVTLSSTNLALAYANKDVTVTWSSLYYTSVTITLYAVYSGYYSPMETVKLSNGSEETVTFTWYTSPILTYDNAYFGIGTVSYNSTYHTAVDTIAITDKDGAGWAIQFSGYITTNRANTYSMEVTVTNDDDINETYTFTSSSLETFTVNGTGSTALTVTNYITHSGSSSSNTTTTTGYLSFTGFAGGVFEGFDYNVLDGDDYYITLSYDF